MEHVRAVFGRRLRGLRKQKGLTQEQLGDAARVNYKWIGAVERGEKAPSFDVLVRLARALGRDYYEFFLPDRLASGDLEHQAKLLSQKVERLDPARVKEFFNELHGAFRKLNASR